MAPLVVLGILLTTTTVAIAASLHKRGRRKMTLHKWGYSEILGCHTLKYYVMQAHNAPLERVDPSSAKVILLDANVILDAVGFDKKPRYKIGDFVMQNRDRVRLCSTVRYEVEKIMENRGATDEMYGRLKVFEGLWLKEPDYADDLKKLESRQLEAAAGQTFVSYRWLYAKYRDVRAILGPVDIFDASLTVRQRALKELYEKASGDRRIAAKAYTLAKTQPTILVTSDWDLLLFGENKGRPRAGWPPCIASPGQLGLV